MPPKANDRFNDPDGEKFGIPTWPWRLGPDPSELATVRQLKAMGRRPGTTQKAGQLGWRRNGEDHFAALYRVDLAKPKRPMTDAMWAAVRKACAAHRTCPECKTDKGYRIPRRYGVCAPCYGGYPA
ncbi:RRQRL motif-containing zinc-binding protein [Streptomyces violaceusniger]|uniref:RRQRL motif-containing zinc-binding protein n=1 Tax=Streptomyces violaceusniger TaxID=68280 RepID=UPI0031DDBA7E